MCYSDAYLGVSVLGVAGGGGGPVVLGGLVSKVSLLFSNDMCSIKRPGHWVFLFCPAKLYRVIRQVDSCYPHLSFSVVVSGQVLLCIFILYTSS